MIRKFVLAFALFGVLTSMGLAEGTYSLGKSLLKEGKWDEAVSYLKDALQQDPENPKILGDLGRAYYHMGSFDKSLEYLNKAHRLDSANAQTILYLGLNYERMEEYKKAGESYQQYLQLGKKPKGWKKIRARLSWLNQLEIKKQIKAAVEKEKALELDAAKTPENSITVLYFQNLSGSERCDHLSMGIAELLTTDLSKAKKLQVVERIRLQTLLDELRLVETGIVDPSAAPRIGRILRVKRVISGTLEEPTEQNLKIASGILSVPTEDYDRLGTSSGRLNQFFQLEKELAFGIIDHLGITLTKEERDEIKKVPTESVLAFLAYCEGLSYEDQGNYGEAADRFRKAHSLDPGFTQAREREERARDLTEVGVGVESFEETCISFVEIETEAEDKGDRLKASALDATGNFIPDDPNAPPEDKQKDPPVVQGTVIIKGDIR